jgi:hypothetical protein
MEAVYDNKEMLSGLGFGEVAETFFRDYSIGSVQVLFWKFFQCWVTRDCDLISDMTDKEIALFLDQLIEYYGVNQVTAAVVRDLLQRMIARLNKNYFP